LRNAFFDIADASGASFRDACLVGTDFFAADLHGASFRGAILCNTIFPDRQIRNGGFDKVDKCCPTCVGIGELCGSSDECCGQVQCIGGQCLECVKDSDCPEGEHCVNNQCVGCIKDSECPFGLICLDNQCVECQKDSDCPSDCVCANLAPGPGKLCVDPFNGCDDPCDQGCPSGQVCVDDGFCGFDRCHAPCGSVSVDSKRSNRGNPLSR
jgi:Pentapeptide repeats (8 copies)